MIMHIRNQNITSFPIYLFSDGVIRKFITGETDTVRILCPATYVIFNPSVLTGVSNNYSRSGTYCTESPNKVKEQLQKCHWRRHCVITFYKNDILNCGQEIKRLAFVEIKQPYCIPKGQYSNELIRIPPICVTKMSSAFYFPCASDYILSQNQT